MTGARVAALAPHPDDEVLGCTSVLTEDETVVVHVTDGVPVGTVGEEARTLSAAREREARGTPARRSTLASKSS